MTLYDDLELPNDCTFEEIKLQYRHLASIHHPDKGGDEERFKRIKFAYEVLSDPARRKQYDENKTITQHTDIRSEAIQQLATVFFSIIPTFDCQNGNLIEAMRNEANRTKNKAIGDQSMNEKYIGNLELIKKKLKKKNQSSENIIMSFIDRQLDTRYKDRELFIHVQKLAEEMLIVLDDYEYGLLELINEVSQEPQ